MEIDITQIVKEEYSGVKSAKLIDVIQVNNGDDMYFFPSLSRLIPMELFKPVHELRDEKLNELGI